MNSVPTNGMRHLTCQECRSTAETIRAEIERLGVSLNPVSDLARILADFEWVGSYGGHVFDTDAGPAVDDTRRAGEVALRAHRMQRVALALHGSRNALNLGQKAKCLQKRIDRLAVVNSSDLDTLWELEVAGAMGRTGWTVEFAETDVLLHPEGAVPFGIECKRPRTRKGLHKAVHGACGQLAKRSVHGVVAISADALIHRAEDQEKPIIYHVDHAREFHEGMAQRVEGELLAITRSIADSLNDHCAGVILCCTSVGWCNEPAAIIHTTSVCNVPNLGVPHAGYITSVVAELLK